MTITPIMSFIAQQRYLFFFVCVFFAVIHFERKETILSNRFAVSSLLIGTGLLSAILLFYFRPIFTFYGTDKSVFLYIGRMMTRGKIPYLDMFDHKGVILYFIQYWGSLMFPNSTTGVWIMEMVNILFTVWGSYRICKILSDDNWICFLTSFFVYFYLLSNVLQGGNFVEEWALPWITWSLYIFIRFIELDKYTWYGIIFLGVACAIVLLLRVNMVGVWCLFLPVVVVLLAKGKRGGEIVRCGGLFLAGLLVMILPSLLWCYFKGCLEDFWKDYILFNFAYTDTGKTMLQKIENVSYLWKTFLIGFVMILCSSFTKGKKRSYWYNAAFFIVSFILTNISGRMWVNYLIVMLPAFMIFSLYSFDMIIEFVKRIKIAPLMKKVINYVMLLFLLGTLGLETAIVVHRTKPANETDEAIVKYICDNTSEEDDVLFLGNYAEMNLRTNRYTNNKYFFQYPPITVSKDIEKEFLESLRSCDMDYIVDLEYTDSTCNWICCEKDMNSVISLLEDLVGENRYEKIVEEKTQMVIYRKKDRR